MNDNLVVYVYKTEKSFNINYPTDSFCVSNVSEGVGVMCAMISSGNCMCTLVDTNTNFILQKFIRKSGTRGQRLTYLDKTCLSLINELAEDIIVSNKFTDSELCHLENGKNVDSYRLRYQGSKIFPIELTKKSFHALSTLLERLYSEYGVSQVENIAFLSSDSGKFKSACFEPSWLEPGAVKISVDMY